MANLQDLSDLLEVPLVKLKTACKLADLSPTGDGEKSEAHAVFLFLDILLQQGGMEETAVHDLIKELKERLDPDALDRVAVLDGRHVIVVGLDQAYDLHGLEWVSEGIPEQPVIMTTFSLNAIRRTLNSAAK